MNTDGISFLQSLFGSASPAMGGGAQTAAIDPTAFLKALIAQLNGASPAESGGAGVGAQGEDAGKGLQALLAQLKLAGFGTGQTAEASSGDASKTGNPLLPGGTDLPAALAGDGKTDDPTGLLAELLAQWQAVPATLPVATTPAATPTTSQPSAPPTLPSLIVAPAPTAAFAALPTETSGDAAAFDSLAPILPAADPAAVPAPDTSAAQAPETADERLFKLLNATPSPVPAGAATKAPNADAAVPTTAPTTAGITAPAAGKTDGATELPALAVAEEAVVAPTETLQNATSATTASMPEGTPIPAFVPVDPTAGRAPTTAPVEASVQLPVSHPDWHNELGDRVVWLSQQGVSSAELKLNPPHLGPLEVRISVNQDQTSVQFISGHAAVREALESSLPKLREMLGGQTQVDVNVLPQHSFGDPSQQRGTDLPFGQQSGFARPGSDFKLFGDDELVTAADAVTTPRPSAEKSLLNVYA